jgi:hypothetical protein
MLRLRKGLSKLYSPARWKAYINRLQADKQSRVETPDTEKIILQIYHSQSLWFTSKEDNGYRKSAEENLARCGALLDQCSQMVKNLEDTLANTPKPSVCLDWSRLW